MWIKMPKFAPKEQIRHDCIKKKTKWNSNAFCKSVILFSRLFNMRGITMLGEFEHDVIKWKHFPLYWPFVRGIHRSLVNSPHKGQSRGALIFSSICAWMSKPISFAATVRLSKQSWGCWFETPSRSLWSHYNENDRFPDRPMNLTCVH